MNKSKVITILVFIGITVTGVYWLMDINRSEHYYIYLPGGFVSDRDEYGAIFKNIRLQPPPSKKRYIGPNVGGYHVYQSAIVGKITPHPNDQDLSQMNISHDLYERRPGYFILDLRTKEVYGGLNKHNWILKLKSYGITEEPELYEPSWRDEKLGRNEQQADIVE